MTDTMQKSTPLIKNRSAESVQSAPNKTTSDIMTYEGVPLKLMDYFGVTHLSMDEDTTRKLKDIFEHFEDKDNFDRTFVNLSAVERKVGRGGNDRMIDKVWRYSRLQNQIKMLNQQHEALYGGL